MRSRGQGIACLLAAATLALSSAPLALSSAAFAQGAGDEQYQDPFGDEGSGQTGGGEGSAPEPSAPAPAAPAPAPAPAPAAQPAGQSTQSPPAGTGGDQLPYTGAEPGLLALAGAALLASGLALRRRSS
jgi:LPXTG-motif cell wall-anchored protein